MNCFISLIIGLVLTLNLSAAIAGGHDSKPGKAQGTSDPSVQPGGTKESTQRQSKPENSGDKDREQKQERDQDCCDDNPGKGTERSEEMRERRDERKQAKADYKSDRVPGQEGKSDQGAKNENADKDVKKPWYEFWE